MPWSSTYIILQNCIVIVIWLEQFVSFILKKNLIAYITIYWYMAFMVHILTMPSPIHVYNFEDDDDALCKSSLICMHLLNNAFTDICFNWNVLQLMGVVSQICIYWYVCMWPQISVNLSWTLPNWLMSLLVYDILLYVLNETFICYFCLCWYMHILIYI